VPPSKNELQICCRPADELNVTERRFLQCVRIADQQYDPVTRLIQNCERLKPLLEQLIILGIYTKFLKA